MNNRRSSETSCTGQTYQCSCDTVLPPSKAAQSSPRSFACARPNSHTHCPSYNSSQPSCYWRQTSLQVRRSAQTIHKPMQITPHSPAKRSLDALPTDHTSCRVFSVSHHERNITSLRYCFHCRNKIIKSDKAHDTC